MNGAENVNLSAGSLNDGLTGGLSGPMTPSLAHGFAELDVELAGLLARFFSAQGIDTTAPNAAWWCAAAALVSRAQASGHVGLDCVEDADPLPATDLLSPTQPVFAPALAAFVARWSSATRAALDDPVKAAAHASGLLVQDQERLYLRRLWAAEVRVAQSLAVRARGFSPLTPSEAQQADALLQLWFGGPEAASHTDQQQACRQALHMPLTVLTGGPGTGKTYTAARLIALVQALRPAEQGAARVALAAPTGKAAARLRSSMEQAWQALRGSEPGNDFWDAAWRAIQAPRTVHALLAHWRRQAPTRSVLKPLPGQADAAPIDLLLIDEASMMDLELLDEVLLHLPAQARLVLIGDQDQLGSVEAGSVLADICGALHPHPAHSALAHSRRFDGTIGAWARGIRTQEPATLSDVASQAVTNREGLLDLALGPQGWGAFYQAGAQQRTPQGEAELRAWLESLDGFRVLAAIRQGPWGVEALNRDIERGLAERGLLNLTWPWPHGQVLMVTRNDEDTGLRNGDVGVVLAASGANVQFAWLAGQELRRVSVSRLPPVEPAYAMTVHKSQGSEFDRVILVLPDADHPVLSQELLYTGLTRARREVTWCLPDPAVLALAAGRRSGRMGGLMQRLKALMGSAEAPG
jgi:exodeoxyribonuclease V alpha subunit